MDASASASDGNVRRAMPMTPDGDRTGLIDSSVFRETMNTSAPSASELLGERARSHGSSSASCSNAALSIGNARFVRLEQEMRTVEQQLAFESVFVGSCEQARDSV